MSGRAVPEFEDTSLRELLVGDYRVIYVYVAEADVLRIAALLHGSRDLPGAFNR